MIDPVSALGLVSSLIQVADFSVRILSKADEIGRSADGSMEENRDIEKCAKELVLRNQLLSDSLIRNEGEKDSWDKDDMVLGRLGHDCNRAARELIECLSGLRSYHGRSTFKSVRQAIKAVYSKEKVESMLKRMKGFQEEINSSLLQSISLRQRLMAVEQTAQFDELGRGERRLLESIRNLQILFASQVNSQTDILANILAVQHNQTLDLINALSLKKPDLEAHSTAVNEGTDDDDESIHQLASQGSMKEIQALLRKWPKAVRSYDSQGRTPLHLAAENGHAGLVSYFIRKGADVNAEDDDFATPLHLAVVGGYIAIVRILLQKGADSSALDATGHRPIQYSSNEEIRWVLDWGPEIEAKNQEGNTALWTFAVKGNTAIVKSLLDQKANPEIAGACGGLPLMKAAQYGHLAATELLHQAGADVNARSPNDRQDTALGLTAIDGHVDVAKKLLEWGADVNAMNSLHFAPLNEACAHGHESLAILLIRRGANPNVRDCFGSPPIVKAAENGNLSVVEALLASGDVNVDSKDREGWTALSKACHHGYVNLVQYLLKHSASPAHRNHRSWTPLHLAAEGGHTQIVQILLATNACEVDVRTDEGETPSSIARKYGHTDTLGVLLNHLPKGSAKE